MTAPEFRAVVVPTRNRHRMLFDLVHSLWGQCDRVIVVDNASDPSIQPLTWGMMEWWDTDFVHLVRDNQDPPNISRLWNLGLIVAEEMAIQRDVDSWDVAVLNSDVVVPRGWMEGMSRAMRSTDAVLAYPDQSRGTQQILHQVAGPVAMNHRITGYAHIMRGEANLRYDETMAWWYSDDDMDWTARERGGALLVPGLSVEHRAPNESTNARVELQEQAGRDRETFRHKWGRTPH